MTQRININTVRVENRALVFDSILEEDNRTRTDIAGETGLSLGTVATALEEMTALGIVTEVKEDRRAVGRKPNLVRFVADARTILVFDLASKDFGGELVNLRLEPIVKLQFRYDSDRTYTENLHGFVGDAIQQISESEFSVDHIVGVGVSVPGSYDSETDRIANSPFPELHNIALGKLIRGFLDVPVVIDHDVFLAATSEVQCLENYAHQCVFYLYLGEGVGGALWTHGVVHKGAREDAGDIGQMSVGGSETLEDLVSWNRLRRIAGEHDSRDDQRVVDQYFRSGSKVAEAVNANVDALARAIQSIYWIVDPHCVIIAGHYSLLGKPFLKALHQRLQNYLPQDAIDSLELRFSEHTFRSARIGAGSAVRHQWIRSI